MTLLQTAFALICGDHKSIFLVFFAESWGAQDSKYGGEQRLPQGNHTVGMVCQ